MTTPPAPPPPPPGAPVPDHPQATTSLVLGIVGVLCCAVTGPFAWVLGKRALTEIDASGGRLGGRSNAQAGYVLGILGTVLLVVGILVTVLVVVTGGFIVEQWLDESGPDPLAP